MSNSWKLLFHSYKDLWRLRILPAFTWWGNSRGKVRPKWSLTPKLQQLPSLPYPVIPLSPIQYISNKTMLPVQTQFQDTFSNHPFQPGPYFHSPPTNKPVLNVTRSILFLDLEPGFTSIFNVKTHQAIDL